MRFSDFQQGLHRRAMASAAAGDALAPWSANLLALKSVGSTNQLGRRILDEYAGEGVAVPAAAIVAWEQHDGRGRLGAPWASAAGRGVYATLLWPMGEGVALPTLPLLVPVGVARAVDAVLGAGRCRIKWPNDLLVDGKKIAGVLLAAITARQDQAPSGGAVIGFGVNHSQSADDLDGVAPRGATSLAIEADGEAPPLDEFAWSVLRAVAEELADHAGDGAAAAKRYQALSIHRPGERLRCKSADGTLEGTFRGFDPRGFLRLELTSASVGRHVGDEVLVTAGEVVAP